jgi:serine/threonine protein phosphatase 1
MPSASYVRRFNRNANGRDWVVGDIHGCFSTLDLALEKLEFDTRRDRLFSVGDLMDRGPESSRAIEYLDKPWFHAVRGNHEQFLLDTRPDDTRAICLWWANGGQWFFDQPTSVRQTIREAVSKLPYVIEGETGCGIAGIVHADVPRKLDWATLIARVEAQDRSTLETIIWGRSRVTGQVRTGIEGIFRVFCGHTPVRGGIKVVGNVFCIDTGAVYGLTQDVPESGLTLMQITGNHSHMQRAEYSEVLGH